MWRAVAVLCLVPRTAPGGRAESLSLHQCTDQCTHSGAGDFSCPFHELPRNWALESGRFPRAPKFPTMNPVLSECQGKPPSMPSALGSRSWSAALSPGNTSLLPFHTAHIKGDFFPGSALHGAPSGPHRFLSPQHCMSHSRSH